MKEITRTVADVLGKDKSLLSYWDKMTDPVKTAILQSNATISTLGELQIIESQTQHQVNAMPKVF